MEVSFNYLENFLSSPFGLFPYPEPAGGEDVLGSKPVIRYQTVRRHVEFVINVTFHQREEAGGGGNTWVAATSPMDFLPRRLDSRTSVLNEVSLIQPFL